MDVSAIWRDNPCENPDIPGYSYQTLLSERLKRIICDNALSLALLKS